MNKIGALNFYVAFNPAVPKLCAQAFSAIRTLPDNFIYLFSFLVAGAT